MIRNTIEKNDAERYRSVAEAVSKRYRRSVIEVQSKCNRSVPYNTLLILITENTHTPWDHFPSKFSPNQGKHTQRQLWLWEDLKAFPYTHPSTFARTLFLVEVIRFGNSSEGGGVRYLGVINDSYRVIVSTIEERYQVAIKTEWKRCRKRYRSVIEALSKSHRSVIETLPRRY